MMGVNASRHTRNLCFAVFILAYCGAECVFVCVHACALKPMQIRTRAHTSYQS